MRHKRAVSLSVFFAMHFACSSSIATAETPTADPTPAFFARHCASCHSGEKPKGDFLLSNLRPDFAADAVREPWLKVVEQLKEGTMPPPARPRPPANEVAAVVASIEAKIAAAEVAASAARGRTVLRRLNQAEYVNTVRDLLDIDVDLKDLLPPDTTTTGFDNSAEAMHVSSYLMDSYLEAAERVIDAAIAGKPRPNAINKRYDIKDEKPSNRPAASIAISTTASRSSALGSRRTFRSRSGSFKPASAASIASAFRLMVSKPTNGSRFM